MTKWLDQWKKQKPKTLLKDPLSGSLKELDDALDALDRRHSTKELALISGAAKRAKAATKAAEAACNKTLHKQTIGWLGDFEGRIDTLYARVQTTQKDFADMLAALQDRREKVVKMLRIVAANPTADLADRSIVVLQAFLTWFSSHAAAQLDNTETAQTNKYLSILESLLGELSKALKSTDPKDKAKIQHMVPELTQTIDKLDTPGGYPTMASTVVHSVVSL